MTFKSIDGTIIDCSLMLAGGLLGLIIRGKRFDKLLGQLVQIIAVFALVHGIGGAVHGVGDGVETLPLVTMMSLCVGYIVGHLLKVDLWFGQIDLFAVEVGAGDRSSNSFLNALFLASALSLIGPLSVLGPIENATSNKIDTLIVKGGLDFIATFVLASRLGLGALAAVVPVFMFQSTLSVVAASDAWSLSKAVSTELSCVGGVILVFLALNILGVKKIESLSLKVNVLKLLPALLVVPLVYHFFRYLRDVFSGVHGS